MPAPRYKWSHPSEWLNDHLTKLSEQDKTEDILMIARDLAGKLDSDELQDLFQDQMDEDGYFTPIRTGPDYKPEEDI